MVETSSGGERLTVDERLRLARKKRAHQVKKYLQSEKHLDKEIAKKKKKCSASKIVGRSRVHFAENVVLLEAAARNDVDEVRQMMVAGVDPNMSNDDGLTALHQSCIDNSEEMMKLLISFGANVNARDSEQWSPLHAAATCGQENLCRILVQHGADLLSVNGDGNMPYDICEHETTLDYIEAEMAKRGITQEIIDKTRLVPEKAMLADLKRLAEGGRSVEFRGRNGEAPLHVAATNGFTEVTQFLLDHKASVMVTDEDLWQPIHCAAYWCQLPVVELLLRYGASLDVRTRNGETAIDVCGDADTKRRILALRKELEGNGRDFKSRHLTRQRSSSTRRGSVKRSSMKEKKALSLKEPREEARFLQKVTIENDDDDDEEENIANAGQGDLFNQLQSKQSLDGFKDRLTTRNAVKLQNRSTPRSVSPLHSEIQLDDYPQHNNDDAADKYLLSQTEKYGDERRGEGGEDGGGGSRNALEADSNSPHDADDTVKHSDTTSPLILKADDRESRNGVKRSLVADDISNGQPPDGVLVSRGRCCKNCCTIL